MKRIAFTILFTATATNMWGQTTSISADMIRPGAVVGAIVCVPPTGTAPSSPGWCGPVAFDPTIVLDTSVTPPVLRAITPVPRLPQWRTANYVLAAAQSGYTIADAGYTPSTLAVYRNGLLMSQGVDYTLVGVTITFVPKQTPGVGDIVVVKYAWN